MEATSFFSRVTSTALSELSPGCIENIAEGGVEALAAALRQNATLMTLWDRCECENAGVNLNFASVSTTPAGPVVHE